MPFFFYTYHKLHYKFLQHKIFVGIGTLLHSKTLRYITFENCTMHTVNIIGWIASCYWKSWKISQFTRFATHFNQLILKSLIFFPVFEITLFIKLLGVRSWNKDLFSLNVLLGKRIFRVEPKLKPEQVFFFTKLVISSPRYTNQMEKLIFHLRQSLWA